MSKALLNRYWRQITSDKRKFAAMSILLALGLLMWGRLLLKEVPRNAVADPNETVATDTANESENSVTPINLRSVEVDVPQTLVRDLFTTDVSGYPRIEREDENEDQAKSATFPADESPRADVVEQARQELNVQSIIMGAQPYVMINGQLLTTEQTVLGFRIVEIADRYVVVEKNTVRLRLGM